MAQTIPQVATKTTLSAKQDWDATGYAAVRAALPAALLATFEREYQSLWEDAPKNCKILVENAGIVTLQKAKQLDLSHHHYRIIDIHKYLPSAQFIADHPSIKAGFAKIFGREPVLCQSLTFEWPSEQPLHQDWAFVTSCAPDVPDLIGAWVAIDKVEADNGPLLYYPGSHNIPRYNYSEATQAGFRPYLEEQVKNTSAQTFLADPGDVLLWHGDLAHAGSKALNKNKRRLSLILHYSFYDPKDKSSRARLRRVMRRLTSALHSH